MFHHGDTEKLQSLLMRRRPVRLGAAIAF